MTEEVQLTQQPHPAPPHAHRVGRGTRPGDVVLKSLIDTMVEMRFQSFFADLPDPMLGVDGRGLVRFANSQAERLFGCPREQLAGRPAESLLRDPAAGAGPSDWARWHESPGDPQLLNRWSGLELVACRSNGSEVPVEVTLSVVGTRDGLWVIVAIRDVSVRKQAEEALRASERRLADSQTEARRLLEQFMDAMPIGVVVATADGHPQYANREAKRLRGHGVMPDDRHEEPTQLYPACVTGTDIPYPLAELPLSRALRGERSHVDDMEIRQPGATVPIEIWGTPVLAGDGSVEYAITAFADVSERRRDAEELQTFGTIVANMAEGVALVRVTDGGIAHANASLHSMFGYKPGEMVGLPIHALDAPGGARPEETTAGVTAAALAEGSWRGEVAHVRKDGTPLWCALNVSMFHHPRLGPVCVFVHTDITARKQAQDAQAQLATIVEASHDAILAKSVDGVIQTWNRGAERLFGYTAAEIIGRSVDLLVPEACMDEEVGLRCRVASGEGVEQYETVRLRKDASPVDVSVTMSPIKTADGRIAGIATICRDVTERKQAEAALLEREEQLAAARDEAMEASRLKSQFLANMSHEIRTPLNGVLGMARLVLTGSLEPEQRHRVGNLVDSGEGLLTIVNDILDFSKVEAGKLVLEEESFDLFAAVESVMSMFWEPATGKGLNLNLHVDQGVPGWVRGDSVRLRQILVNILGNAVKFTDDGSVSLGISQGAPGALRFEVRDTGIGIEASAKARLLEPFSQADASTTRRFGGTGLGLAICQQLVGLMGGHFDFASQAGVGTTFWFEVQLPAAPPRGAGGPGAGDATSGREPHGGAPDTDRPRILLADDTEINREVGKGLLENIGYQVDAVSSGAEAIDALRNGGYAAVLMDCLMPVMDGYEATGRIRGLHGPVRHTPIIALTAAAMIGDRERCLAAGMDDYVTKPLDLDMLTAALARCSPGLAPKPVAAIDRQTRGIPRSRRRDDAGDPLIGQLRAIASVIPSDAFRRICQTFLSSTPELMAQLSAAVHACDADGAAALAHKLKGTMGTFGAVQLSSIAQSLEEGNRGGSANLEDLLGEMDEEYARVRSLVVSLIPQGASA